jgi:hypothetical protein
MPPKRDCPIDHCLWPEPGGGEHHGPPREPYDRNRNRYRDDCRADRRGPRPNGRLHRRPRMLLAIAAEVDNLFSIIVHGVLPRSDRNARSHSRLF